MQDTDKTTLKKELERWTACADQFVQQIAAGGARTSTRLIPPTAPKPSPLLSSFRASRLGVSKPQSHFAEGDANV